MGRKCFVALMAVLLCFGAVAVAETFTWTGGGANALWSTCGNWTAVVPDPDPCYPAETTDDVMIDGEPPHADRVFLETNCPPEEDCLIVDDITFKGTFTIDNAQTGLSRLIMDSMRIVGGTNGATLTITNDAPLEGLGG